jgi:serine phosphatase RsbU (regulator of sigma subunit)
MARSLPSPPAPAWKTFARILWRAPLLAIPFALFFGVLFGATWGVFQSAYVVSVVFSYTISLANWGVGAWFDRRVAAEPKDAKAGLQDILVRGGVHMAASVVASFVAAAIIHAFIYRGFMGGPRQMLTLGMFSLLFSGLVMGIAFAFHFYHEALRRARSEEELTLARRIQRSYLLSSFPAASRIEVHALNLSSKQVSGDFYDVVPTGDGGLMLCVADVSGKGVPAALLGSMLQASLRTQAPLGVPVGTMIRNVNALLCASSPDGQFATIFLARLDEARMRLDYVNAGHNPPILLRSDGTHQLLDAGGPVVGVIDPMHYDEGTVALTPGDRVVLYSDGLCEALDRSMEMFGVDRVQTLAASVDGGLAARDQIDAVLAGWRGFLAGEEPQDDVTLMIVRVLADAATAPVPVPIQPRLGGAS